MMIYTLEAPHVSCAREWQNIGKIHNFPIYKAFNEYGICNFYIELIENCPCNNREELNKKEGECIRALKPSLNKYMPGRTAKEYFQENKETRSANKKEYWNKYTEMFNTRKAEKVKCVVSRGGLSHHKRTNKHKQLLSSSPSGN